MRKMHNFNKGFSLTECLLAIGTLAVGMLFIAGVFPVGIHFTTVATERTIAAVVADEAFAKIRLYAIADPTIPIDDIDLSQLGIAQLTDFNNVANIKSFEFAYPSTAAPKIDKQYYWSALCRRVADPDPSSRLVQVTVFVCRKPGPYLKYPAPAGIGVVDLPTPFPVGVSVGPGPKELTITNPAEKTYINDGYTIVGNERGRVYRVLERYVDDPVTPPPEDQMILLNLDKDWGPGNVPPNSVWVVPPPISGGKRPCVAVYQRVIRF